MGDRSIEAGAWMLEHTHRALLALRGGRFPKKVAGMQPVELHTIGRKTGLRRSTLLTSPLYAEDRVVLVASKGGLTRTTPSGTRTSSPTPTSRSPSATAPPP